MNTQNSLPKPKVVIENSDFMPYYILSALMKLSLQGKIDFICSGTAKTSKTQFISNLKENNNKELA